MAVQIHSFLTSALDGGEWSASSLVNLPQRKLRVIFEIAGL